MPSMKVEGDSDGDGDLSGGDTERSGGSSRGPDRDSSAEEADEPDSDDSSEMDESECERRRNECLDNLANLERQFTVLREQLYSERMKHVEYQLTEVRGGRSQEYLGPLRRLQDNMRIRIEVAGILKQMRIENIKHKYDAEEQAAHQHFKPRPVPLPLKEKVEKEIQRLVQLDILEKVDHADVATPIVPVLRADGDIRICGDYSVTLNKALYVDNYPVPRIEELFAKLYGGEEFTKLDLSRAYNQLELDESRDLTCINTHKGLYRYKRLVFGLTNAPYIFQQTLENLLRDIEGVCIFIDDILVTGHNRDVHIKRLEQVLSKLEDAGMRLRRDKCELFKKSVEYLGFIIDKHGLHKSPKKVEAILNCERPKNATELKSFIGLVNYYRCFVPNTSSVLSPLNSLLKKNAHWQWDEAKETAFCRIKQEMASERTLAHYNPDFLTIVTSDAGPEGLGAILSQTQPSGEERVVAYASRSLSRAETNYAQIQKEAAGIVFAVKKFHHYLYGRMVPFVLRTDHKPLITIFGDKKGIPEMAANRLQRYALFLSGYNFRIEYVKSEDNVADFLSRSITNFSSQADELNACVDTCLYINYFTDSMLKPVTLTEVKSATDNDKILRQVKDYVTKGWPRSISDEELKPYYNCRLQLNIENGCILRGPKLIIPTAFREQILDELHSSHFGVVKTKSEARSRMWWPNIDKHIEEKIGSCSVCNTLRPAPPRAPLAVWPYPKRPWQRVHIDMFSLEGKQFLVIVDAHSKWVECFPMQVTDTKSIVNRLEEVNSRFGLMQVIVTDNATNFCSNDFKRYCVMNGIKHVTSPPYHPASNGQAESSVKTIKKAIKLFLLDNSNRESIHKILNKILFDLRNSVHSTTGFSPAQLMLGRSLRCRFDLLQAANGSEVDQSPTTISSTLSSAEANQNVSSKQISQAKDYGGQRCLSLGEGDQVLINHYFKNGNKHVWKKGFIKKVIGSRLYLAHITDLNLVVKKHIDQLLLYKGKTTLCNQELEDVGEVPCLQGALDTQPRDPELVHVVWQPPTESQDPEPEFCETELEIEEDESLEVPPDLTATGTNLSTVSPEDIYLDCELDDGEPGTGSNGDGDRRNVRSTRNPKPLYK